ncbi:MAG: hypothetical protein A2Y38_14005 [Spirochaetes bacterium GWB1_59_5]|nr:MAG: hypothetical protein A2Y38_14005 [Spirochaetes bacterium GWB1_59_5]
MNVKGKELIDQASRLDLLSLGQPFVLVQEVIGGDLDEHPPHVYMLVTDVEFGCPNRIDPGVGCYLAVDLEDGRLRSLEGKVPVIRLKAHLSIG